MDQQIQEEGIDIYQFLFRSLVLTIFEFSKIHYGQGFLRSFFDCIFYFFFLYSTSYISDMFKYQETSHFSLKLKANIFFTFILLINISELASWNIMGTPFTPQAIGALDPKIVILEYPIYFIYALFVLFLIVALNLFPFGYLIVLPKISFLLRSYHILFLFIFLLSINNDLHEISNKPLFDFGGSSEYFEYLRNILFDKRFGKPQVLKTSSKLKNLILVQLESFPNELVRNPNVATNLHKYAQQYEYIAPIYVQQNAGWSISATSVLQVGIPQIFPDEKSDQTQTDSKYMRGINGLPDILFSHQYTLDYVIKGKGSVMGFDKWVKSHHYMKIYSGKNDLEIYTFVTEKYFPRLDISSRTTDKRHMAFIVNEDTHAPNPQPKWCHMNFPNITKYERCFHCVDSILGKLIDKFIQLKMYEHSVLVLYPDHTPFNSKHNELFMLFPGMKKISPSLKVNDEITYYDFAPTMLDLVGVYEYVPKFPYGRSIYLHPDRNSTDSPLRHNKPDENDFAILFKFLHYDKKRPGT